jgi:hypothetical protein
MLALAALYGGWQIISHGHNGMCGYFSAFGATGLNRFAYGQDLAGH